MLSYSWCLFVSSLITQRGIKFGFSLPFSLSVVSATLLETKPSSSLFLSWFSGDNSWNDRMNPPKPPRNTIYIVQLISQNQKKPRGTALISHNPRFRCHPRLLPCFLSPRPLAGLVYNRTRRQRDQIVQSSDQALQNHWGSC